MLRVFIEKIIPKSIISITTPETGSVSRLLADLVVTFIQRMIYETNDLQGKYLHPQLQIFPMKRAEQCSKTLEES